MTRTFPLLRHGLLAVLTSAGAGLGLFAERRRPAQPRAAVAPAAAAQAAAGPAAMAVPAAAGPAEAPDTRSAPTVCISSRPARHRTVDPRTPCLAAAAGSTEPAESATARAAQRPRRFRRQFGIGQHATPRSRRPRDGRTTVGQAVARPPYSPVAARRSSSRAADYGGYYPWGYGGLGFGGYYGGTTIRGGTSPYPPVYGGAATTTTARCASR